LTKRNAILLILAVVLLGAAALVFIYTRKAGSLSDTNAPAPIVCENCGTEFSIKSNDEDPVCPNCGASATIRRLYFRCTGCGHVFMAYEYDAKSEMVREPGGKWYPKLDCPFAMQCPKCGATTEYVRNVRKLKE
jgi:predicted RNA-binding Zn-ribbon protein involved in translation (DUF1610 family)